MLFKNENDELLISKLANKYSIYSGKVVVTCGFDEMVTELCLSRVVTEMVSVIMAREIDHEYLDQMGHNSFEAIAYLNRMYYGIPNDTFENILSTDSIFLKPGFSSLIWILNNDPDVELIFISCGILDVLYTFLSPLGITKDQIYACEFNKSRHTIIDNKFIIDGENKSVVVDEIRKYAKAVIGIGHSEGDLGMLEASDISITDDSKFSVNTDYYSNTAKGILYIIDYLIKNDFKKPPK